MDFVISLHGVSNILSESHRVGSLANMHPRFGRRETGMAVILTTLRT